MKIFTVIGARPQFIKSAAINRTIKKRFQGKIQEITFHTGQHFDQNMSNVFFEELKLIEPKYQLDIPENVDRLDYMSEKMTKAVQLEKPDVLLVYGDTHSTLIGAQVGAKANIPVAHVEAGLRSFNNEMPEEYNRVECDKLSTLLFSPTKQGLQNLIEEGFPPDTHPPYKIDNPKIYHCGDVMYDNSLFFGEISDRKSTIAERLGLKEEFILLTVHRNYNTDKPERLSSLLKSFIQLANQGHSIVFPLHPRTKKMLQSIDQNLVNEFNEHDHITVTAPLSFLDIIVLEKKSKLVMTDSGGMQKEAYFFKKPCVILREETEWVELVENGNAILTGADPEKIITATEQILSKNDFTYPPYYGNGKAAYFICNEILKLS